MISKSNRLQALCDLTPDHASIADIGADHGALEVLLLTSKQYVEILAIENKSGPYHNLFTNLRAIKNVRLSFSDGLEAVDTTIDTLILAGMGGMNIINILKEYPNKVKKIKTIIVDAHKNNDKVRRYIVKQGFEISKEVIVKDSGLYYVLTKFERTDLPIKYSPSTYEFGLDLYNDSLWGEYKKILVEECDNIISYMNSSNAQSKDIEKINERKQRIKNYGKN